MGMNSGLFLSFKGGRRGSQGMVAHPRVLLLMAACGLLLSSAAGVAPTWWTTRGVIDASKTADDYSALNQGQLKNLVRAAVEEMNDKLPGGAGADLNALLASWQTSTTADDYAAVNIGQLKAMATKVRTRLIAAGMGNELPALGTTSTDDDDDFALANVGQAKAVFAFAILTPPVEDGDNDGDGLSNQQELLLGTDPEVADTDNDGVPDGQEVAENTNPQEFTSNLVSLVTLRVFTPLDDL